jgi:hypothetical protein
MHENKSVTCMAINLYKLFSYCDGIVFGKEGGTASDTHVGPVRTDSVIWNAVM